MFNHYEFLEDQIGMLKMPLKMASLARTAL